MIRSAPTCRDLFSMDLIGGEESFEMFSHYEDSIYRYIYDLSGEKAQWDKVEIDTADPADIPGLKGYVSVKELVPDLICILKH